MRWHRCVLWGLGLLLWGGAWASSDANAAGYGRWDLPSNLAQYFGYGFGPGYHAPRIRVATTPAGYGAGTSGAARIWPAWLGASSPGAPVGFNGAPARAGLPTPWASSWSAAGDGRAVVAPEQAWPAGRVEPLPPPQSAPPQR